MFPYSTTIRLFEFWNNVSNTSKSPLLCSWWNIFNQGVTLWDTFIISGPYNPWDASGASRLSVIGIAVWQVCCVFVAVSSISEQFVSKQRLLCCTESRDFSHFTTHSYLILHHTSVISILINNRSNVRVREILMGCPRDDHDVMLPIATPGTLRLTPANHHPSLWTDRVGCTIKRFHGY